MAADEFVEEREARREAFAEQIAFLPLAGLRAYARHARVSPLRARVHPVLLPSAYALG